MGCLPASVAHQAAASVLVMLLLLPALCGPVCIEAVIDGVLNGLVADDRQEGDEEEAYEGRPPLELRRRVHLARLLRKVHLRWGG